MRTGRRTRTTKRFASFRGDWRRCFLDICECGINQPTTNWSGRIAMVKIKLKKEKWSLEKLRSISDTHNLCQTLNKNLLTHSLTPYLEHSLNPTLSTASSVMFPPCEHMSSIPEHLSLTKAAFLMPEVVLATHLHYLGNKTTALYSINKKNFWISDFININT